MKLNQNLIFTALILTATAGGAWAQTEVAANAAPANGPAASAPAPAPPPITAADIQSLKDALAAQQQGSSQQRSGPAASPNCSFCGSHCYHSPNLPGIV